MTIKNTKDLEKPNSEQNKKYIAKRLDFPEYKRCLDFPKFIEIETIRACNSRCVFCPVYGTDFNVKPGRMSDELLAKIYKELKESVIKASTVCVCRDGEPLLDKRIAGIIKDVKSVGIPSVTMSTNAQLLDKKKSIALLNSGLDELFISIDGFSEEVFKSLRVGLNYNIVVKNTIKFIELRDQINPKLRLRIRMVVVDENKGEVKPWNIFWKSKCKSSDLVQAKPAHSWGNQLYKENKISVQKMNTKPCIAPFNMFVIHYNGLVTICGHDYKEKVVVGDLNKNSIREIWQGKKFASIRQKHLTPGGREKIEFCRGCQIWDRSDVDE